MGGASTVRIERPEKVPVRLTVIGGSGGAVFDGTTLGEKGGKASVESRGWADAKDRYDFEVGGGSKMIEVVGRPS